MISGIKRIFSLAYTMTRRLFHSGEYILISGDLPDKCRISFQDISSTRVSKILTTQ